MTTLVKDTAADKPRPDFSKNANHAATAPAYLSVWDLHAYYGESYIVQGVNFNVHEGEILACWGATGPARPRPCAPSPASTIRSTDPWRDLA
jgi:ABC-type uncharacterized transport system ATPase subunit